MGDISKMLAFAKSKWHKVKYSMGPKRFGPDYMDCSSFVFYCLIAGGFLPKNYPIGNTESLYKLKGLIFEEIYSYDDIKAGDIFIKGIEGNSNGAYGHTGIFLDKNTIIHCNATNNTVSVNGENSFISSYLRRKRSYSERYFRPITKNNKNYISKKTNFVKIKDENWRGVCLAPCNVRAYPSTNSEIVAVYEKCDIIYYDSVYEACGYRWISYIASKSKKRRFVAYRDMKNNQWISFE